LDFENVKILLAKGVPISSKTVNLLQRYCDFLLFFFKMAGVHLGFVWGLFWTTHEEYLVAFITVQNLVAIDAVVLIT